MTTALPVELSGVLHQRTEGNPLFLVTVVEDLVQQGVVRHDPTGWNLIGGLEAAMQGVPESLRQLLEQQFAQLAPSEQGLLEAASVAGTEFAAAAIADGVDEPIEAVESQCVALARRGQFVQERGSLEWPDRSPTEQSRRGMVFSMPCTASFSMIGYIGCRLREAGLLPLPRLRTGREVE